LKERKTFKNKKSSLKKKIESNKKKSLIFDF